MAPLSGSWRITGRLTGAKGTGPARGRTTSSQKLRMHPEHSIQYHWSLMQAEYAMDIVFRKQADLSPVYQTITREAVIAVKAEHVATFLGRKLDIRYQDEVGNDFSTRIEGTRRKNPTPEGPALVTPGRGYFALAPEGPRLSCPSNS